MENKSGSMNEKMVSQEHDTERTINKKDNKAKNEVLTYIRDYRVMTNLKYRLITNILIPLLAIFTSMLIACSKTIWAWIGVIVIVYDFYMMCEVVQDYFCFGCMCKKNAFGMHFLKTGFNGVRYFENAVLVDILVRPIRIGITVLIASMPFINLGVNIQIHGSGNVYLSAGAYSYLTGNCRQYSCFDLWRENVVYRTCVSSGACRSDSSDILSYDGAYPQIIC